MQPMPTGARPPDPLITARYKVEFAKLTGVFTDVSTASAEVAPVPYEFTGADGMPSWTAQPGKRKVPTITLKRGVTKDISAWTWHQEVLEGKMDAARCSGTIFVLDSTGAAAAKFNVINAWPSKVDMPALATGQNAAGVEIITLVCEAFERVQ